MKRLAYCLMVIFFIAAAICGQSRNDPALTNEQRKEVEKAEKLRKQYPLWLTVEESTVNDVPVQIVAYLGLCGGNFNWIFCSSSPITTGGVNIVIRARWEPDTQAFTMRCPTLNASYRCSALLAGRYPARKLSGWKTWPQHDVAVLANFDQKVQAITFAVVK